MNAESSTLPIIGNRIETRDLARDKAIAAAPGNKQDPLFCIVVREFNPRAEMVPGSGKYEPIWEMKQIYRHADCAAAAKLAYIESVTTFEGVPMLPFEVVGVSQPIGCIALDNHGNVCKL